MGQTSKQYPLSDCALYKIRSKRRLAKVLKLSPEELKDISKIIEYRNYQIPKKDGDEKRNITAPGPQLKRVQSRVLKLISGIKKPNWVISSTKGKCYLDNAPLHLGSPYVLTMDIKSFFDNCSREYIYRFFRESLLAEPDCAKILTDICTMEGRVPTGTPTSQILAYFAYKSMFDELDNLAQSRGMMFSLYVDDMTFSSSSDFSPVEMENAVRIILRKYGHSVHSKKTKYSGRTDYKVITGVCIDPYQQLVVPNSLRKRTMEGFKAQLKSPSPSERNSTLGRIESARRIEKGIFPEVERLTKASS